MEDAMRRLMMGIVVLVLGCATGGGRVIEEPPAPPIPAEEPVPTAAANPNDPYAAMLARFEAAYREMACKLNRDYDPTSSVGMLAEPYAELERLVKEKSKTLEVYVTILEHHGYKSVDEYFKDRERLDLASPKWFGNLSGSLFDILEECGP